MVLLAAAGALYSALYPVQAAHAAVGTLIADAELARADGPGKARVFGDSQASVLVFFRSGQDRSASALRELAKCQKAFASKPVRWVGLAAESSPSETIAAMVRDSGFTATILVDGGDTLYGSLGIALHPVVVVADRDRKLAAFEPFRSVDFCTAVSAQVRHALREITGEELRAALEPVQSPATGTGQGGRRYRALAEALLKAGNLEKALENARKSAELEPGSAASHALIGTISAAQGNCAAAEPAFRQALVLDPASDSAKAGLGRCRLPR